MRLIFILIVLLFSLVTRAENTHQGIEVSGHGQAMAIPDQFMLVLYLKERGLSAAKTKQLVDDKSHLVINAAREMGIDEKTIESAKLTMRVIYQSNNTYNVPSPKNMADIDPSVTVEVSRSISIPLKDLSVYDQLLDTVVQLGVRDVSPLEMTIANSDELYQQALNNALSDAKIKAQAIAKKMTIKLGHIRSIQETSQGQQRNYQVMAMESRASNFSSSVTEKAISAQVRVIFAIEP